MGCPESQAANGTQASVCSPGARTFPSHSLNTETATHRLLSQWLTHREGAGHAPHPEQIPDPLSVCFVRKDSGWLYRQLLFKKKQKKTYKSAPYQDFILPNHPPEVNDSGGERTLGCDVCSRPIDSLKQHSDLTWRHLCRVHQQN